MNFNALWSFAIILIFISCGKNENIIKSKRPVQKPEIETTKKSISDKDNDLIPDDKDNRPLVADIPKLNSTKEIFAKVSLLGSSIEFAAKVKDNTINLSPIIGQKFFGLLNNKDIFQNGSILLNINMPVSIFQDIELPTWQLKTQNGEKLGDDFIEKRINVDFVQYRFEIGSNKFYEILTNFSDIKLELKDFKIKKRDILYSELIEKLEKKNSKFIFDNKIFYVANGEPLKAIIDSLFSKFLFSEDGTILQINDYLYQEDIKINANFTYKEYENDNSKRDKKIEIMIDKRNEKNGEKLSTSFSLINGNEYKVVLPGNHRKVLVKVEAVKEKQAFAITKGAQKLILFHGVALDPGFSRVELMIDWRDSLEQWEGVENFDQGDFSSLKLKSDNEIKVLGSFVHFIGQSFYLLELKDAETLFSLPLYINQKEIEIGYSLTDEARKLINSGYRVFKPSNFQIKTKKIHEKFNLNFKVLKTF